MTMATQMKNKEVRVVADDIRVERRADGEDEGRRIVGHAAVFNSPTEIAGLFREQIAPGAFTEAIQSDDVRALVDHDPSRILGRNRAGTLKLAEDERGLLVDIDPPDTQIARDIIVSMDRGDVTGMSFGFRVMQEKWEDGDDGEMPLRTIQEASLFDVSVVTFPAYADTDVAVRSFESRNEEIAKRLADEEAARAEVRSRINKMLLRRLRTDVNYRNMKRGRI